ncbi:MAG: hypothetical protein JFR38_05845 [Muribaculaceae bacterium]|nr:hypothetical protein [Muribaculaceae bacterium]
MFSFFRKKTPVGLWVSTDIHCHILPGIDDGSPTVERSIELVERMQEWGLKRIFASPHVTQGSFCNTPETIGAARRRLQEALDQRGNGLVLGNSAEYRLDDLFAEHRAKGILQTLPGKRLLVENSFVQEPMGFDNLLFDLQVDGFSPILVHPERYYYYYATPERYRAIHNAGVEFQINVLSLSGYYGKDERRMAEKLIEMGLVDYIGTDLHGRRHVESISAYLGSRDYKRHRGALEKVVKNDFIGD